ncbi:hypothetical protein EDC01DRAFT_619731 [Geopyxis carbonaria]|nr:hypothetical protein EDC01DRAFT_619731 [Geopyxis carbonaria]
MRLSALLFLAQLAAAAPAPAPVPEPALSDVLKDGVGLKDVEQGILPDFLNWDFSSDKIQSQLGLGSGDIDQLPLKVLNIPGYANYTSSGWNLRIHGQAYKEPLANTTMVPQRVGDEAANVFLPDLDISQLQPDEQTNARNLTAAVLSIPQGGEQLEFTLKVSTAPQQNFTSQWNADIRWGVLTDSRGEVDGFVNLPTRNSNDLPDGSNAAGIVKLDVHTTNVPSGNATAYLVPTKGVTIISDIDDILRVTKIYKPKEGLLNTFARDFVPWMNMPSIYSDLSRQHPEQPYHFHYLTTTPEQATRVYEDFIYTHYPLGSFDTRPLNFTTVDQTFNVRRTLLNKVVQTFPERKFVLVGDTTNSDVLADYPAMMKEFPNNIQCILLRNTSATDPDNKLPYDTSGFKDLPKGSFMFFVTPEDLRGIDFNKGECQNVAVQQNVTYGYQNLPLGIKDQGSAAVRGKGGVEKVWWVVGAVVAAMALV